MNDQWKTTLPQKKPRAPHMVEIRAKDMQRHALIVGQSGSGKSYFIGRLIEELAVRTRARCVVIDPNSDYFRIDELNGSGPGDGAWEWGRQFTEDSFTAFRKDWRSVPRFVKTAPPTPSVLYVPGAKKGKDVYPTFFWHQIPADLVAAIVVPGDDAQLRRSVRNIHTLVSEIGHRYLVELKSGERIDGLENLVELAYRRLNEPGTEWPSPEPRSGKLPDSNRWRKMIGDAASAWEMYRSFAARCSAETMPFRVGFSERPDQDARLETSRLEILDVGSLEDPELRALVTGVLIRYEWDRSKRLWQEHRNGPTERATGDPFYPTFVFVDEAHNVLPRDGGATYVNVLREQIRTIAAEGRKYGLYLVVCSQRPDKLDTRVVSECVNVALLRMVSESVLKESCALLGIDIKAARPCLSAPFNEGFGILFGDWAGDKESLGRPFKGAARRIAEGGVKPSGAWTERRLT